MSTIFIYSLNNISEIGFISIAKFFALIYEYLHEVMSMFKVGRFVWTQELSTIFIVLGIVLLWVAFEYYTNTEE